MPPETKTNVYSFRVEEDQSSSITYFYSSNNWNDQKSRTFNKNRIKMILENLSTAFGSIKKRKRIGRGQGSGKGGTSTRGHKGAKSRSGFSDKLGFEGGQLPLHRRIPKFGFKKQNRKSFLCINIYLLQTSVKNKILFKEVTPDILKQSSCISRHDLIKILGSGQLTSGLTVTAHKFSQSSIESIKSAGGEVILLL